MRHVTTSELLAVRGLKGSETPSVRSSSHLVISSTKPSQPQVMSKSPNFIEKVGSESMQLPRSARRQATSS